MNKQSLDDQLEPISNSSVLEAMDDRDEWREKVREIRASKHHADDEVQDYLLVYVLSKRIAS